MLSPFADELTKISLEIKVHHEPPGTLAQTGFVGKYFSPETVAKEPILQQVSGGKKHVLALPQKEDFKQLLQHRPDFIGDPEKVEQAAQSAYQSSRRHELTHYLRGKKGKMERYGKPGVRGVLSTGREELAAYGQGLKPFKKMGPKAVAQGAMGVPGGVMGSIRTAYPEGIRKAMMGGQLGSALQAAKKAVTRRA